MLLVGMTIAETKREDKGPGGGYMRQLLGDWVLVGIVVLSSVLSFGLGWLASRDAEAGKGEIWIEEMPLEKREAVRTAPEQSAIETLPIQPAAAAGAMSAGGEYVASKTGTKYYLPWCGTAKRIKDENKVWFGTKAEAEAAGYEPASNCKGL